jgi:hypothetical protein
MQAKSDRDTDFQKVSCVSFQLNAFFPDVFPSYRPSTTASLGKKKGGFVGTKDNGTGWNYRNYETWNGGCCCGTGDLAKRNEQSN